METTKGTGVRRTGKRRKTHGCRSPTVSWAWPHPAERLMQNFPQFTQEANWVKKTGHSYSFAGHFTG